MVEIRDIKPLLEGGPIATKEKDDKAQLVMIPNYKTRSKTKDNKRMTMTQGKKRHQQGDDYDIILS